MLARTNIDRLQGHREVETELNRIIDYINNMEQAESPMVDTSALDNIVDNLNKLEAEVVKIQNQVKPKRGRK